MEHLHEAQQNGCHDTHPDAQLDPQEPTMNITLKKASNNLEQFLQVKPKLLGIVQIMTGIFLAGYGFLLSIGIIVKIFVIHGILGILLTICGILAIIAQKKLSPALIKACMAMDIMAATAGAFFVLIYEERFMSYDLWNCTMENGTDLVENVQCQEAKIMKIIIFDESAFLFLVSTAISIAVAVYCCKAVQLCQKGQEMEVALVTSPSQ
ncbi:uncharacterized protein LOC114648995 [Erpetoichthys calabaricus]|uniref:uncharacterized protein LOC114648995 n=1 Tax=Erpetoichthys calabaricus TaxID=27687 RepID=UPI0010A02A76|nr:uncharacterized protein LOC114648995 [Erpetoichthys calabaricus]XP_028654215.1 uncharacterized protein LOC114648995 [Erpetoichthys calabaricus]